MKKLILISALFIVCGAQASFNSDLPGQSVRCVGHQMIVVINKARTEITVISSMDPGHPEKYRVLPDGRTSDGDTMISYRGSDNTEDPSFVDLNFDDQGDSLVYREDAENPIILKCP